MGLKTNPSYSGQGKSDASEPILIVDAIKQTTPLPSGLIQRPLIISYESMGCLSRFSLWLGDLLIATRLVQAFAMSW